MSPKRGKKYFFAHAVGPKLVHIFNISKKDESVQTESTHMVQLSSSTYMYKMNFVIQ